MSNCNINKIVFLISRFHRRQGKNWFLPKPKFTRIKSKILPFPAIMSLLSISQSATFCVYICFPLYLSERIDYGGTCHNILVQFCIEDLKFNKTLGV